MNKKVQTQFAERCGALLESGISLSEALSIIERMEKSKKYRKALKEIIKKVEMGTSLSRSMLGLSVKFEPLLISMISHGEASGILALSLRQASEITKKGSEIKKKLLGALIYPAFIALSTVIMSLFLVLYIFPKIMPLFSSMNIELPLMTRIVQRIYEILLHYGIECACGLFIFSTVFYYFFAIRKSQRLLRKVQMMILILPIIGNVVQKYFICISSRSASTLLECGQALPTILEQLGASSGFEPYCRAWKFTQGEVERGIELSESLRSFETLFPTLVPDMLSIGERTGTLSNMFQNINKIYEQELDDFIKQLSVSIEPILMIFMGLIVGSIALSIILPIYEITNHLSK